MAPLLSRLGIDRSGFGFGRRSGVAGVAGVSAEYLYTGAQQTTLAVPLGTTTIKFAGVGAGGDSAIGNAPNYGSGGGGGGAANLSGYTINPASPYAGTTLYIGVGGPSAPRNTYVRTTSHSGPIIFEINQGSNGSNTGTGGNGGAANPTYGTTAGASGGPGGARFIPGTAGTPATGSCAGGGGAGGYGDASPLTAGAPGASGGNVTMSPPSYLQPNGFSPWTWGSSTSGGSGGSGSTVNATPGNPAPNSGATGGYGSGSARGGGGGGGAGIIINGVSYGGGGGGEAYIPVVPATLGGPTGLLSKGAPGFLIVQLS